MLNLLYTQLFRLVETTLFSVGLDPFLGAFHEGHGRYAALASDMMEPFRFLVDRIVINAINHKQIRREDFRFDEKAVFPVMIGQGAMKRLLSDFEGALAREITGLAGRKDSFRGHIYHQCQSLRKRLEDPSEPFLPFEMKW
jgi:CRISPR-associated endonuclease Cas1